MVQVYQLMQLEDTFKSDSFSTLATAEGNTELVGQSVAELTDAGFNIVRHGWLVQNHEELG